MSEEWKAPTHRDSSESESKLEDRMGAQRFEDPDAVKTATTLRKRDAVNFAFANREDLTDHDGD
ncbi:MAG: hypothetical protein AAF989_05870 [Planctomycetota bacterium]